jgi:hypothetical protein
MASVNADNSGRTPPMEFTGERCEKVVNGMERRLRMSPERTSIAELAYQLWVSRGCPEGSDEVDWLEAERQIAAAERRSAPASHLSTDGKAGSESAARSTSERRSRGKAGRDTRALSRLPK